MSLFKVKQWKLTSDDKIDVTDFENWKTWLLYCIGNDTSASPFLPPAAWQASAVDETRGLVGDAEGAVPRLSQAQKIANLEMMLGFVAVNTPILSRRQIVHESTSLEWVFNEIREYFGFQVTGARWLDFESITLKPDERPQALYQRLNSFVDENLRKRGSPLLHKGQACAADEKRSETVDNMIMSRWLHLVNAKLPMIVKTQYSVQLKTQTVASLKSDIFSSLDSLLLMCEADPQSCRTSFQPRPRGGGTGGNNQRFQQGRQQQPDRNKGTGRIPPRCSICTKAGQPSDHYLRQCKFLLPHDQSYLSRQVDLEDLSLEDTTTYEDDYHKFDTANTALTDPPPTEPSVGRVQVSPCALWQGTVNGTKTTQLIDSGSGGDMIRHDMFLKLGLKSRPAAQGATQADGRTPLNVIGETSFNIERDGMVLAWSGLIVKQLSADIICGTPFMERHDISIRPARKEIIFHTHGNTYQYNPETPIRSNAVAIRRVEVLRAPESTTIYPGEKLEVAAPEFTSFPE